MSNGATEAAIWLAATAVCCPVCMPASCAANAEASSLGAPRRSECPLEGVEAGRLREESGDDGTSVARESGGPPAAARVWVDAPNALKG